MSSVTACLSDMPHLSKVKLGPKVAQAEELGGIGVIASCSRRPIVEVLACSGR